MGYSLRKVRIKDLKRNNIRKHFEPARVCEMGDSLASMGQITPIITGPGLELYDGEYRVRGAECRGIEELLAIVSDEALTPEGVVKFQFVSAVLRTDLTPWEKAQAMKAMRDAEPGATVTELAKSVGCDPKMFKIYLSPFGCVDAVRAALQGEQIGISDCYEISQVPQEEQAGLLSLKLSSSVSRDDIARERRRRRNGSSPAVRVGKVRCHLPGGATVTVSADELGMDELVEALNDLQKEARKARDQGLDIKTFQSVMRDRASAAA